MCFNMNSGKAYGPACGASGSAETSASVIRDACVSALSMGVQASSDSAESSQKRRVLAETTAYTVAKRVESGAVSAARQKPKASRGLSQVAG